MIIQNRSIELKFKKSKFFVPFEFIYLQNCYKNVWIPSTFSISNLSSENDNVNQKKRKQIPVWNI